MRALPRCFQGFAALRCVVLAYCQLQLVPPALADAAATLEHVGLDYNPELQLDAAGAQVRSGLKALRLWGGTLEAAAVVRRLADFGRHVRRMPSACSEGNALYVKHRVCVEHLICVWYSPWHRC